MNRKDLQLLLDAWYRDRAAEERRHDDAVNLLDLRFQHLLDILAIHDPGFRWTPSDA